MGRTTDPGGAAHALNPLRKERRPRPWPALGRGDASITELAARFQMTLTGMKKHVVVLEQAGLVTTEKVGRVRTCKLGWRRLAEEAAWIEKVRQLWEARFDDLDKVVEELKRKETSRGQER